MTGICKKFICFILFALLIVTSLAGVALDGEENVMPAEADPIEENTEISTIGDTVEHFASNNNENTVEAELAPLNDNTEISAIGDTVKIPVQVVSGFHYGDKKAGETIAPIKDASWCGGYFNAAVGNTYKVTFRSAWKATVPYIFLCDGSNTVRQVINSETALATNEITFTVTDETVVKVYIRSQSTDPNKITVTQIIDANSTIDSELIEDMKLNIVTPYKYSAWPLIGEVNGKLVCLYTVADQHVPTETSLYMKTSSTGGITWTEPIAIFTDKTATRKGYTGVGNDSEGNLLIWYRGWAHELYKTDGETFTQVYVSDLNLSSGAHIGNILTVPGQGLYAFYNTYGDQRSWGFLKSVDDGLSWEMIPVEENIDKSECPAEIDGVYLGDGKILALGRKDATGGTGNAMFQMQSSDYGATWTKEYTNITDAYGSSPSMRLNSQSGIISLYYLQRSSGQLKLRQSAYTDVWDAPLNWNSSEIITSENATGQDTGNVKTIEVGGMHLAVYYAGSANEAGVYGVFVKPEERPTEVGEKTLELDILNGYHYGDPVAGDTIQISENASWSCASFDAVYGKKYTVTFKSAWKATVPYIYFCNSSDVVVKVLNAEVASQRNEITFTVDDKTVTKIYVRSNSTDDSITATMLPNIIAGDINGDEKLDVCDLVLTQKMLDGWIPSVMSADLNSDDIIDSLDAAEIRKIIIK